MHATRSSCDLLRVKSDTGTEDIYSTYNSYMVLYCTDIMSYNSYLVRKQVDAAQPHQ
jgi:hypothetical protein